IDVLSEDLGSTRYLEVRYVSRCQTRVVAWSEVAEGVRCRTPPPTFDIVNSSFNKKSNTYEINDGDSRSNDNHANRCHISSRNMISKSKR
ncbi:hypothetical protein L9F63_002187, partial [Diploptera punctata]